MSASRLAADETCSMSPSVFTSVVGDEIRSTTGRRLRRRATATGGIGERMVALARSSAARSEAAVACATWGEGPGHLGLADHQLRRAARCGCPPNSTRTMRMSSADCAIRLWANSVWRARRPAAECLVRALGLRRRFFSLALRAPSARRARPEVRLRAAQPRPELFIELDGTAPS